MTFLNPLVLIGLTAAAIPVLLHLFNLRKLKTVDFSTLRFLEELQKTKIRRLKLRQWILMLLRTLLILLLVGAFARPTVQRGSFGGAAADARATGVILIDDSYSMTAADERGPAIIQAKSVATTISGLFQDTDDLSVIPFSRSGIQSSPGASSSNAGEKAPDEIADVQPQYLWVDFKTALSRALSIINRSRNLQKEIYVLSDFQRTLFRSSSGADETSGIPNASDATVYLLPIGTAAPANLSIESVTLESGIIERGKPLSLRVTVGNHAAVEVKKTVVSIYLDDSRVTARSLSIPAESNVEASLTVTPQNSGFVEGMAEIEEDDLPFDNRAYFTFKIPETRTILLVGQPDDLKYLRLALRSSETASRFQVREITAEGLDSAPLSDTDALVLVNPGGLTSGQSRAIRTYVEYGGGLILFAGPRTLPQVFNASVAGPIGLPKISSVHSGMMLETDASTTREFDFAELRHPLFQDVFENRQDVSERDESRRRVETEGTPIESPHVRSFVRFEPTVSAATVIRLTGGSPFLLDQRIGAGKALLFAVPPDEEWSDLPVRGIFVPLLHRSIAYVGQQQTRLPMTLVGGTVTLNNVPPTAKQIVLRSPGEEDRLLAATPKGSAFELGNGEFNRPGIYDVVVDGSVLSKIGVNCDPLESDLRAASPEFIISELVRMGFQEDRIIILNDRPAIADEVFRNRLGVELWQYFLIASLIIAITELFVSRSSRKEARSLEQSLKSH